MLASCDHLQIPMYIIIVIKLKLETYILKMYFIMEMPFFTKELQSVTSLDIYISKENLYIKDLVAVNAVLGYSVYYTIKPL